MTDPQQAFEGYNSKNVLYFVIGLMYEHDKNHNVIISRKEFDVAVQRMMHLVILYLRGLMVLDHTHTELQREVCFEAKKLFLPNVDTSQTRLRDRRNPVSYSGYMGPDARRFGSDPRKATSAAQIIINQNPVQAAKP